MPYPKKPPALKVLDGSRGPADIPPIELPLVDDLPSAPDWMPNAHAVAEFDRLARVLYANKLLTQGGVSALAMLAALHGKLVQLWSAGESPTGHMLAQYRNLVNDFGLTPVAQGKVRQVGGKAPEGNKFADNGRRSA